MFIAVVTLVTYAIKIGIVVDMITGHMMKYVTDIVAKQSTRIVILTMNLIITRIQIR